MTGEEMGRAVGFLSRSRANSEARLSRLEGSVERITGSHERLAAAQGRTQWQTDQLRQGFVRFQDGMDELRQQVAH